MIKESFKASGALVFFGVLAMVLVLLFSAMAVFGFGIFQRETANFRGDVAVREDTQADPNFRIAAYDQFFDLCSAVQADEDRLDALASELEDPDTTADRAGQIRASVTAIRASRAEKVREYNTRAAADYTTGQFQASNLPAELEIDHEETQCTLG